MLRFAIPLLALLSVLKIDLATAQSVTALKDAYSGAVTWDESTKVLSFTSSGELNFPDRQDFMERRWDVPADVKTIHIAANVQVTGFFFVSSNLTIQGEDQKSSVIYGTPEVDLLRRKGLDKVGGRSTVYSAILAKGNLTVHINNLTVLDPYGFMFTGKDGAVMHLYGVRGIDDRGGEHSHSDGISAANGSTVRECYFEAGDDVIKVYADIYVENTTIHMIRNSVPIQFGWGNYGSGATAVFRNLTITGDSGRGGTGNAIVNARYGYYDKTLIFQGLKIDNPNSTLFDLNNEPSNDKPGGGHLAVRMDDVQIQVKEFAKRWNMEVDLEICGKPVTLETGKTTLGCE